LRDLYDEYTQLCEAFGNGVGSCNHQWAGYFYDGLWLIAQILDTYLVQQNNSLSNLGTLESRQALYNLSLAVDFYGQTGRVSQWRSATGTELDREGIVLLRQATGTPEKAFGELAYRTAEGFQFQTDILWTSDGSKKVLCQGKLCQLQSGWIPLDGVDQCHPGEVWPKELGCSKCDPGTFSSDGHGDCEPCPVGSYGKDAGMAQCVPCAPGTANPLTGMTACIPCLVGHFMNISGALLWQPLAKRLWGWLTANTLPRTVSPTALCVLQGARPTSRAPRKKNSAVATEISSREGACSAKVAHASSWARVSAARVSRSAKAAVWSATAAATLSGSPPSSWQVLSVP